MNIRLVRLAGTKSVTRCVGRTVMISLEPVIIVFLIPMMIIFFVFFVFIIIIIIISPTVIAFWNVQHRVDDLTCR